MLADFLHTIKNLIEKNPSASLSEKEAEEHRLHLAEKMRQAQENRLREEKKKALLKNLRDMRHNAKVIDVFSQSAFECCIENDILRFDLPLAHNVSIKTDPYTPLVEAQLCVEIMNMLGDFITKYATHIQSGRLAFYREAKLTKTAQTDRLVMTFPNAHNLVFVCEDTSLEQYRADILSITKDATDIISKLGERKLLSRKRFAWTRK